MAMGTEEKSDGLVDSSSVASTTQRQRFYIELKPGETTTVSWRKLLRDGKTVDQCPSTTSGTVITESSLSRTHSSSAHQTPEKPPYDKSEVGQCNDPFSRNERLDHNTSSGHQQLRKGSVEMTEVERKKNDDPSKHVRLEDTSSMDSAKTAAPLDKPFSHSSVPPMIKDRHLDWPQSSEALAPLVMYKKEYTSFSSKSNSPLPFNEIRNASMFPSKTKQSALLRTEFSFGRSGMKAGILGDPSDVMRQNSAGKCIPLQTNHRCRKLMEKKKIEVSSRNEHTYKDGGSRELLDVVSLGNNYSSQHLRSAFVAVDDAKPVKPFSKVIEGAIRELEKTVAASKSFKIEASDAHTSWLTIERELPLEVKLKLGEVARLVQSSEERISEELVNFLVRIVGKLVHGKTSKRLLRKFVMLKLCVKKENAEKLKAIKSEILAMVLDQQVTAADCFEAKEDAILAETYKLDSAIEDKLCDLYDLCVQGLSEDKGAEVQKLFIELGDLWPKGVMDHHKLRDAISRAKSRRRVLVDKDQGQKAVKSDGTVSSMVIDDNRTSYPVPSLKRKVTDSHCLASTPPDRALLRKATVNHPAVPLKTLYPLPRAMKQNFPTERKLKTSGAYSRVEQQKEQVLEKKDVNIRFCLKSPHGTHMFEEQSAMDELNCSRVNARLTYKQSGFLG